MISTPRPKIKTKSDGIPKLGMIWPTVPATNSLQDTHG
jgi:hypothetical protein